MKKKQSPTHYTEQVLKRVDNYTFMALMIEYLSESEVIVKAVCVNRINYTGIGSTVEYAMRDLWYKINN